MSISEILEQNRRPESKIFGVVVGIVTDNKDDPEKLARIKVLMPHISGEEKSNWARVATFMTGKNGMGSFFLPENEDEVLVAFENGDINRPFIIGSLWNGKDKPPLTNEDGENNIRMIKSRSGHIIRLDDKDGEEKIEIVDKSEKNTIVIDTKDNKISIVSEADIEISAPNGTVTIEGKDIEIKSEASAKIEGEDIEIKSNSSTKIEAGAGMELKASSDMTIKGSTVNIN